MRPLARARPTAMRPRAAASSPSPDAAQRRVLFLCLGNICRSPAAEGVFKSLVANRGLSDAIAVDSCGTGGGSRDWFRDGGFSYHEGDAADPRMTAAAAARNVRLTSRSRPLTPDDLRSFDRILTMDAANERAVERAVAHWIDTGRLAQDDVRARVQPLTSHLRDDALKAAGRDGVPDPYYGGPRGFETVLDLLEDACDALLDDVVAEMEQG